MDEVRTRFAPSPTGSLHVGGARTALYCLLYARRRGGRFLLRIEDTDQARSTDESTLGILRDLEWLGLRWDEGPGLEREGDVGPYYQSRRRALYDEVIARLLAEDRAYEAWETREELDAERLEAERQKSGFRYRRRRYAPVDLARFRAEGRTPVVRLEVPERDHTVRDLVLGSVTLPADDREDIVLRKADGFPTYHFAVVVDDHHMGITDVLRGQEHFMNTPKHLAILEALGWAPPRFAHLPILFNPQGGKMSKRDKARHAREAAHAAMAERVARGTAADDWTWLARAADLSEDEVVAFVAAQSDAVPVAEAIARVLGVMLPMIEVMDFRRAGYLPEALVNYLALLGWSPGDDREIMSFDEMVAAFDLDRVNKTPARFDPVKLEWMNHEYMKALPIERLQELMALWLEVVDSPLERATAVQRRRILELYRERAPTFARMEAACRFFFVRPEQYDEKGAKKHLLKGGGLDALREARRVLAELAPWDEATIEAALTALADASGGLGKVAQPLRMALAGAPVTPGLFETVAFFDRPEVLLRIDRCLAAFPTESPSGA